MTTSPGAQTAAISARGLNVQMGKRNPTLILKNLSFTMNPGEITGLLGPSGCGKTTLMRTLVGVQHFNGELTVLGTTPGKKELRGKIGYVTQNASVYQDLSVIANLSYFAKLGCTHSTTRTVSDILHTLGLENYADRTVSELSGGQQSRVSLGCALIAAPELLVMDEPTVGLDPLTRSGLWQEFRDIARTGAALIISSHVLEEAARCDKLILMREGAIIWQGTPTQLLSTTGATNFEDAFLAAINSRATAATQDSAEETS
ncbi:ABC transporter ATP-binding protein [Corynebacterium callunae]|uniref:ABC transporter ATP-binding protein n=1 Tax=Corynebacterium callunae TaxID=1721 RepID=UPI0039828780